MLIYIILVGIIGDPDGDGMQDGEALVGIIGDPDGDGTLDGEDLVGTIGDPDGDGMQDLDGEALVGTTGDPDGDGMQDLDGEVLGFMEIKDSADTEVTINLDEIDMQRITEVAEIL